MREALDHSFKKFMPEFLIYNAGTDLLVNDQLGQLNITKEGIIKRDELVFRKCLDGGVPIVMLLSGGY